MPRTPAHDLVFVAPAPRRGRPPHLRHGAPGVRPGRGPRLPRAAWPARWRRRSTAEQELRRALAEAEHRAANPVLDEATLTAALGQETARVLRSAHEAAAELVGRAEARRRPPAHPGPGGGRAAPGAHRAARLGTDRPGRGGRHRAPAAGPGGGGVQGRGGQARGRGARDPGPGRVPGHGRKRPRSCAPGSSPT